jgi:hypothetical protein
VVPAIGDTIAAGRLANAFINDDLPINEKDNNKGDEIELMIQSTDYIK